MPRARRSWSPPHAQALGARSRVIGRQARNGAVLCCNQFAFGNLALRIGEAGEDLLVQELIPKATDKRLDKGVLCRLTVRAANDSLDQLHLGLTHVVPIDTGLFCHFRMAFDVSSVPPVQARGRLLSLTMLRGLS